LKLFPFQQEGVDWLATKKHALLADEMGLGKSAQAIRAADKIGAKNILVVCPASVRDNWVREFEKFGEIPRKYTVVTGGYHNIKAQGVTIINPELILYLGIYLPWLKNKWDLLIVDEAHHFKNLESIRTKAVLGKGSFAHHAERTWLLTGTPAPNHVGELYSYLYVFGFIKIQYLTYVKKYCNYIDQGYYRPPRVVGSKKSKAPELRKILEPFMLRRLKRDVMKDLPPIIWDEVFIEKDKDAFTATDAEQASYKNQMEFIESALASGDFAEDPAAFAQSVSTVRKILGIQKVKAFCRIIEEELKQKAYDKIVIFGVHREVMKRLAIKLHKFKPVSITGQVHATQRQSKVDQFQNDPECRVFLGNISAAGEGITLTKSSTVAFIEQEWTPGKNKQAADRLHRIGQINPVYARFFGVENSIDARITSILRRKTSELTEVFDKGD